jgi:arylsulfatase A-like enzyme
VNSIVLPWLKENAGDRFFLYLHYFDPHWDYDPPPPYNTLFINRAYKGEATGHWKFFGRYLNEPMPKEDLQRVIDLYDGEIAYTDAALKALFDELKAQNMWEDSLIVVTADHGEEFQERGSLHHIKTLYQEVLHVPLIVKLPGGQPQGWRRRISEQVSTIDIAPTILELANLPVSATFQGRSLVPLLQAPGKNRISYARTLRHSSNKISMLQDHFKLIYTYAGSTGKTELYDLTKDPGEQHSLHVTHSAVSERMKKQVLDWMQKNEAARLIDAKSEGVTLTPEQKENLRALGYTDR